MKTKLLIALSMMAVPAMAQQSQPKNLLSSRSNKWVREILEQQMSAAAVSKPTATLQRIIAQSRTGGGTTDSTVYRWNTTARGAAHNPKISASYQDAFSPYADGSDERNSVRRQFIAADSEVVYGAGGSAPLRGYTYDAANRPTRYAEYLQGMMSQRTFLTYNSAGQITYCNSDQDTGLINNGVPTGMKPALKQYSSYNAAGKLVKDSMVNLMEGVSTVYLYTYTAAGNMSQIATNTYYGSATPDDMSRVNLSYNSNGLLTLSVTEQYDASTSSWMTQVKDSIGYTGNNPAYTFESFALSNPMTGAWIPIAQITATLNAAGNWSEIVVRVANSLGGPLQDVQKQVISYNSFNNYQKVLFYAAVTGTFPSTPTDTYNYYYQTYNSNVGVGKTPELAQTSQVAPNPANGSFQILRNGAKTSANYMLLDASGRVLRRGVMNGDKETVDVSGVAGGLYFLTVQEEGNAAQTHRVVVQ
jgi:hypothetical protein